MSTRGIFIDKNKKSFYIGSSADDTEDYGLRIYGGESSLISLKT